VTRQRPAPLYIGSVGSCSSSMVPYPLCSSGVTPLLRAWHTAAAVLVPITQHASLAILVSTYMAHTHDTAHNLDLLHSVLFC
jgi:hypothetical protein